MGRQIKPAGKVFRDPVHNLIRIDRGDEILLELIDTPEFQRLRRIRQLGVSWLTYHGAEHSRFSHSLGVLAFAQKILQRLQTRYAGHEVGDYLREHALSVKCAALLHDIGHGPFSHLIERAFAGSDHETKTVELIRDPNGNIQPILGGRAELVADIIAHATPHALLTDIVSSQLDADRMDYLLRDSHATGVQYGKYDPDWLINTMCIGLNPGQDNGVEKSSVKPWRLCLDESRATDAAEQFILARDHMNVQVYFHRVTRGFEVLLLNLFKIAADQAKNNSLPTCTPEVVAAFLTSNGSLPSKQWLWFDEVSVSSAFHCWSRESSGSDGDLMRLAKAYLYRDRLYSSASLENMNISDTVRLVGSLTTAGLIDGVDWGIDDIESTVYKGIRRTASKKRKPGASADTVESILVSNGHPSAVARRVEAISSRFNNLDNDSRIMQRLYFDREKSDLFFNVDGFPPRERGAFDAEDA